MMLAQAMVERGALESLVSSVPTLARDVTLAIRNQPWIWVVLIAFLVLLVVQRRR
jgi:hypothetical protein